MFSVSLFHFFHLLLGIFLLPSSNTEPLNCLAIYKFGSAPVVFRWPKCPRLTLPSDDYGGTKSADASGGAPANCQVAVFLGKRRVHESFLGRALGIRIPVLGAWSVAAHRDRRFCWHFGFYRDGDQGQCISPAIISNFFGLLNFVTCNIESNHTISVGFRIPNFRYKLNRTIGQGSYGEAWLAFLGNSFEDHSFILKRLMVERSGEAYLTGLREKYFGEIFLNASASSFCDMWIMESSKSVSHRDRTRYQYDSGSRDAQTISNDTCEEGLQHIARFVESFELEANAIWLVFNNEGVSLHRLLYTDERDKHVEGFQTVHPSAWWHWLRTTEEGNDEMKSLIRQLLMALKSCHDRNITHRDIKPENMIVCFKEVGSSKCLAEVPFRNEKFHIKMRIIDFGSALDNFTLENLYPSGPTRLGQTFDYTPPEALLNSSWYLGPCSVRYDMWSVGVFMLELIFGSSKVFQISDRSCTLIYVHLDGWSEPTKELACKLRSFIDMCISVPGISHYSHQRNKTKDNGQISPTSLECSEEFFSHHVKSRDPLKLGFPNIWALRLVRQLLVWNPGDRLSVDEALRHPYFN